MNTQTNASVSLFGLPPSRPTCTRRACAPDLIAAAAEAAPDAIALSAGDQKLTYGALNVRADELAGYLKRLGVGREVPVALCLERSFDYVIAALAVWKAGAAYVSLDPNWSAEVRELVIEDAQAPVLITRGPLASKARFNLDLDLSAADITSAGMIWPPASIQRENLAYISYTFGSTGRPNGVEVTHGNLLNLVFWHRRAFGITASDCASHIAEPAVDAAVWELWPHLTAGASIALADEKTRTSPDLLRDWITAQRVTVAFVPTVLAEPLITGACWPQSTSLRYLLTGSDTLHGSPSADLPFTLVNTYGPAECTVVATSGVVPPVSADGARPTIGAPISHTETYLLDENLRPVLPGSTGEMYIGGTGVARGYRNRPELTAARFLRNPFSLAPGARMYRTGDLGSLLPDGQIAFRGRVDNQEEARGHRSEPDEIASVLSREPGVASCAVATHGPASDRQLVAYIVRSPGVVIEWRELRDSVRRQLPAHMIPAAFVRLSSLPLCSNGTLDRAALPAPNATNAL